MTTYLATIKVQLASKSYETTGECRVEASNYATAMARAARYTRNMAPRKKVSAITIKLVPLI